jgi:hypothetical protein
MILVLFFAMSLRSLTEGAPIIPEDETPKDFGITCQQFRTLPSIVYSCLLTMFACMWTAVHPNLPDPDGSKVRVFGRRIKIVLIALLAPEYILYWALEQRKAAKALVKAAKAGEPSVISRNCPSRNIVANPALAHWTIVHGYFLVMGGFVLEDAQGIPLHPAIPGKHNMDWADFIFPHLSEKQIRDRSKGDAFTKLIVLAQLSWFLTQCIARGVKHLPLTELELATAAHVALTVLIYAVWWDKPLDVACYIPVSRSEAGKEKTFSDWDSASWSWGRFGDFFGTENALRQTPRVPTFFSGTQHHHETADLTLFAIQFALGSIFGSIHCIAWNFDFPSRTEQLLWRISSGIITGYAGVAFLTTTFRLALKSFPDSWGESFFAGLTGAVVLFGLPYYIVARLILLFLALFTLRDLPPNAHLAVRWTTFLPHLGS